MRCPAIVVACKCGVPPVCWPANPTECKCVRWSTPHEAQEEPFIAKAKPKTTSETKVGSIAIASKSQHTNKSVCTIAIVHNHAKQTNLHGDMSVCPWIHRSVRLFIQTYLRLCFRYPLFSILCLPCAPLCWCPLSGQAKSNKEHYVRVQISR